MIVDGNEQKAIPVLKALSGLRTDPPALAHCLQSEYYYPSSLLTDLTANHLAHVIEEDVFDYEAPPIHVPNAKYQRGDDWGQAYSALVTSNVDYTPAKLLHQRGDSVRERICCWYDGAVALDQGVEIPMSDSINPIVRQLRQNGYEDIAEIFAEL